VRGVNRFVANERATPLSSLWIEDVHESRPEPQAAEKHRTRPNRRIGFFLKELHRGPPPDKLVRQKGSKKQAREEVAAAREDTPPQKGKRAQSRP
jgi:hypothetical protein